MDNEQLLESLRKRSLKVFSENAYRMAKEFQERDIQYSSCNVDPVEHKSRSGFIPFTKGGASSFIELGLYENFNEKTIFNFNEEHAVTKRINELIENIRQEHSGEDGEELSCLESEDGIAIINNLYLYDKDDKIEICANWEINWECPYYRSHISWNRKIITCYFEEATESFDRNDIESIHKFIDNSFEPLFKVFKFEFEGIRYSEEGEDTEYIQDLVHVGS